MPITFGQHDSDVPILAKVTRDDRAVEGVTLEGEYRDIDDGSLVQELTSDGETDEHGEVYFEEFDEDDLLDDTLLYDVRISATFESETRLVYRDEWGIPSWTDETWTRFSVGDELDAETDDAVWEFDDDHATDVEIRIEDDHYREDGQSLFITSFDESDVEQTWPITEYYARTKSGAMTSQPDTFRFSYREQSEASGYGVVFFNSDEEILFALFCSNPQFGYHGRESQGDNTYTEIYDPSSDTYEFWVDVTCEIDWGEETVDLTWDGTDGGEGIIEETFELCDVDPLELGETWIVPKTSSDPEISGSGGVWSWFDITTRPSFTEELLEISI